MPNTIVLGKKKKTTGKGSGDRRASARTQARMAGTPPGASTAAKYENLDASESDYSEQGDYRQPLPAPRYRKEEWSYVDEHRVDVWTSTASCYYIKQTHEKTNLPPRGPMAREPAPTRRRARNRAAKKTARRRSG
jgi:hypothetical protein